MSRTVYTIGYEGASVDGFLNTLLEAGVSHVIDIRDVPASRKPGFSKSALASSLDSVGICYTHLKPLGDPKPGRDAMRGGDYEAFLQIYERHISQPVAQVSLKQAIEIAETEVSVLLCYERDPKFCHRTLVAERIRGATSLSITNLGVRLLRGKHLADSDNNRAHAIV